MKQQIRHYGVQSFVHFNFYARVEPRPEIRIGLDGKRWCAYRMLPQEDVRLNSPSSNMRADYIFVDPADKVDARGLIDVYLVSKEQERVKHLIAACRFEAIPS
jgi:hypothetical protein